MLLSGRWCLWKLDLARIVVSRMNHGCGFEKKVGPKGRKWSQDHTPTCIRLVHWSHGSIQMLLSGRWCLWKLDLARIVVSRMNHGRCFEKKVGPKGRKWSHDPTPTCIRLVYGCHGSIQMLLSRMMVSLEAGFGHNCGFQDERWPRF